MSYKNILQIQPSKSALGQFHELDIVSEGSVTD